METKNETEVEYVELAILRERLRSQETILNMKDAQIRDLQASRDKLLEQNNRLTLLLPAPVAPYRNRFSHTGNQETFLVEACFWIKTTSSLDTN